MAPAQPEVIVTTTTIFKDEPTSSASAVQRSANGIPVGAIAGGTAGGAFLAFFLVFVWIMWGKKIKRHELKQQKELNNLRITHKNTMMNTSKLSRPRISHLAPVFWVPDSAKVQFADNVKGGRARNAAKTPADPPEIKPSLPKVLRPVVSSPDVDQSRSRAPLRMKTASLPKFPSLLQLNRKPFVTSSTDASENALPGSDVGDCTSKLEDIGAGTRNQGDTQRPSWPHSLRSSRGRTIMDAALSSRTSRTSQATSGSAYSQPDDPSTVVGVAL
ncbi:hypothetical protein DFS33DRAFT_297195 [Desarmillaria ectypa]|nr:hypothetical protein DFS33DRAFT_297195 [Desarmillaria ectypa]